MSLEGQDQEYKSLREVIGRTSDWKTGLAQDAANQAPLIFALSQRGLIGPWDLFIIRRVLFGPRALNEPKVSQDGGGIYGHG